MSADQSPRAGDGRTLTEQQIEKAWRLGFRAACDAERLNSDEEWGYKAANVIETVSALAAAPAVSAPAALVNERKPLTWEQFKKIVQELYGEPDDTSMDNASAHDIEGAMAVVRAVERAHGIQAPATADPAEGSQP